MKGRGVFQIAISDHFSNTELVATENAWGGKADELGQVNGVFIQREDTLKAKNLFNLTVEKLQCPSEIFHLLHQFRYLTSSNDAVFIRWVNEGDTYKQSQFLDYWYIFTEHNGCYIMGREYCDPTIERDD